MNNFSTFDLSKFNDCPEGYYQVGNTTPEGKIGGWIPAPMQGPIGLIEEVPDNWPDAPFYVAFWANGNLTTTAKSLLDLIVRRGF